MTEVIGIKFNDTGRTYFFDPEGQKVNKGDMVIVETSRGLECGETVDENMQVEDDKIVKPLRRLVRIATEEDLITLEKLRAKEKEAFDICVEKILFHQLDMKLVDVEFTFDSSKALFYFTADERVDFRELVKDLAATFKTRIELRQIGVRDESKMIGGLGMCGRVFCCSSFLDAFQPVSIRMAKEQGLSLNPVKISGTCGRLMCCLKYEQEAYEELIKITPKVGSNVDTPEGRGVVTEASLISGNLKVRLDKYPDALPQTFHRDKVKRLKGQVPKNTLDITEEESGSE